MTPLTLLTDAGAVELVEKPKVFTRLDVGLPVPDDGYRYFRVKHAKEMGFAPRNARAPMPAVAHKSGWGTTVSDGRDYLFVTEPWQWFFRDFIDAMTNGMLEEGAFIGYYTIKNNPDLKFHDYTPGTLKWIYSRMYQDAVWATDAGSFTTGAKDYVLGLNMSNREVWQYLSGRPCTGALLRLKQDRGAVLRFECLDSLQAPPDPASLQPWQYYWCTQEHPDYRVTRFPQYANAFEAAGFDIVSGTPSPLLAPGGWLEMKKTAVVELKPGEIWKPYYP